MGIRGRARSFDPDWAARQAMLVFWKEGYNGATLRALKLAMGGICSPSLYAAYGSKEQLFIRAIAIYAQEDLQPSRQILQTGGVSAIRLFFKRSIQRYTAPSGPKGCLVDTNLTDPTAFSWKVTELLQAQRAETSTALLGCLDSALLKGELSKQVDPVRLARLLAMFLVGLSGQARLGTSREQLLQVTEDLLDSILPPDLPNSPGGQHALRKESSTEKSFEVFSDPNLITANILISEPPQVAKRLNATRPPAWLLFIQLLNRMRAVVLELCGSVFPTNSTWRSVNDKNKNTLAIGKTVTGNHLFNTFRQSSIGRQFHNR